MRLLILKVLERITLEISNVEDILCVFLDGVSLWSTRSYDDGGALAHVPCVIAPKILLISRRPHSDNAPNIFKNVDVMLAILLASGLIIGLDPWGLVVEVG